ncbi:MAG: hypothetical protein GJ680_03235 [Alteromonadaceae bacterium]|nr:hypothetical protein [Alteromonadaceae bacterium]
MAIHDIEQEPSIGLDAQPIFELEDEVTLVEPVEFELEQANDEPSQEFELEEPELIIESVVTKSNDEIEEISETGAPAPETETPPEEPVLSATDESIVADDIEKTHTSGLKETLNNPDSPSDVLTSVEAEHPHTEITHDLEALKQAQLHQRELNLVAKVDELIETLKKRTERNKIPEQSAGKQFSTGIHYIKYEDNHYLGAKWFRKAGLQGHAKAQLYLGLMFIKGEGVPKSLFHAYAWITLANCQKLPEAENAIKQLAQHLTAKQKSAASKHAADLLEQIHTL